MLFKNLSTISSSSSSISVISYLFVANAVSKPVPIIGFV